MIIYQCFNQLNNRLYAATRANAYGVDVHMYDVTSNGFVFRKRFYLQDIHVERFNESIRHRYAPICAISPSARQCQHVNSILEI